MRQAGWGGMRWDEVERSGVKWDKGHMGPGGVKWDELG